MKHAGAQTLTQLEPLLLKLRAETFAEYKAAAEVASFAEDKMSCGRWPAEGALARSLAEFDELLPQGAATSNNHCSISSNPSGVPPWAISGLRRRSCCPTSASTASRANCNQPSG
jgi:hypothetical protein